MNSCRLRIEGRVQGVGYRAALADEARRLGLRGWVRNRSDGSVEALVAGESDAIEALAAWAAVGPPSARVARVERHDGDGGVPAGLRFEIVHTI